MRAAGARAAARDGRHDTEWRDPAQIASLWREAAATPSGRLRFRTKGAFWETLAEARVTLLVTREYEHLVVALSAGKDGPAVSYLPMPHPSGVAVDRERGLVYVASTRNPNQVFTLAPVARLLERPEVSWRTLGDLPGRPLVPVRSFFLPGCLYLHDLALVNGVLHGNAVGQNAVVRLGGDGRARRVWWPRSVDTPRGPLIQRNHLQLNSIAAGTSLETSFFSASAESPSARRPGHRNFPVDGRGVVFSGATREPVARGLTRPHSARLHRRRVWVENSGYGTLGTVEDGGFTEAVRLPGWTRGLSFRGGLAFAGTSRVLPRFRHYAPGLDPGRSVCGVHIVEVATGRTLGSLVWPSADQIFAVELVERAFTSGFPFRAGARPRRRERELFYAFETKGP